MHAVETILRFLFTGALIAFVVKKSLQIETILRFLAQHIRKYGALVLENKHAETSKQRIVSLSLCLNIESDLLSIFHFSVTL